ncbi:MAG: nitroreductase family protein [Eubacteriales bacterium]|nr:nitroreductase family protein [Eubacteriales bacterium]
MDLIEAIQERHSVRKYKDKKIEEEIRVQLDGFAEQCNEESGLHISIHYDDPEGFDSRMAHYGSFSNVNNFIVLAGKDCPDFDERCGYYGEKLVLKAQQLGLNTCWAALTYNKKMVKKLVADGEKLCMIIALGYGETSGVPHKSKSMDAVLATKGNMPEWFRKGAEAALLAPTAVNQQKFKLGIIDGEPAAKVSGIGFYTKVDLGIVKYHFEIASGKKVR